MQFLQSLKCVVAAFTCLAASAASAAPFSHTVSGGFVGSTGEGSYLLDLSAFINNTQSIRSATVQFNYSDDVDDSNPGDGFAYFDSRTSTSSRNETRLVSCGTGCDAIDEYVLIEETTSWDIGQGEDHAINFLSKQPLSLDYFLGQSRSNQMPPRFETDFIRQIVGTDNDWISVYEETIFSRITEWGGTWSATYTLNAEILNHLNTNKKIYAFVGVWNGDFNVDSVTISGDLAVVPLPAALPLLAFSIGGLALFQRKRKLST